LIESVIDTLQFKHTFTLNGATYTLTSNSNDSTKADHLAFFELLERAASTCVPPIKTEFERPVVVVVEENDKVEDVIFQKCSSKQAKKKARDEEKKAKASTKTKSDESDDDDIVSCGGGGGGSKKPHKTVKK
jgi:hypothetical protein